MGGIRFGRIRLAGQGQGPGRIAVKKLGRNVGLLAVLLVGLFALVPAGASAEPLCTDTWTGPAEGGWTTAADWSTGKVPMSASVACIGSGKTVINAEGEVGVVQGEGTLVLSVGTLEVTNVLESSKIADLTLNGGQLSGAATVNVSSSLSWVSGTMSGSGSSVLASGASGTISGEVRLNQRTLVNNGTLTQTSYLTMKEGAKIENTSTFTVNGEIFTEGPGALPLIVNTGTLQKTEGPTAQILGNFENKGTVSSKSNEIRFNREGATLTLASGSKLEGLINIEEPKVIAGSFNASGTVTLAKSSLSISSGSTATIANFVLEGSGTLTGAGTLKISSSLSWSGEMSGSGSTVLMSGASGSTGSTVTLTERTFVNEGTLTIPLGNPLKLEGGAGIKNSGTLTVNGGLFAEGSGPERLLVNTGVLQKTEVENTIDVQAVVENMGVLHTDEGRLIILNPKLPAPSTQWGGAENPSAPNEPSAKCGKPVSCATGNESETQTDFAISGRGVGLDLTRTYNSQAAAAGEHGAFGYGWTSSFSDHLVVNKTSKVTTLYQADGSTVPFTEETGGAFKAPVWTQDTFSGTEGTGYTLTLASQIKYKFAGSSGRLESVTDRDGNATTLTYNGTGQLTTITDPVSRTIKLKYNGEGLVESAEDPMKHVVKYTYEESNLKSVTQPGEESLRWQFKYDGSHRMTEMVDGRSGKTINEYNGSNQVTKQEDPAGHKLKFEYEAFQTKITNENTGGVTDEYFTSNGEPASITRGYGTTSATTESFTYNEGGYVISVTDGNGHTTTYGYSAANDRTSMVDPNKNETKWTYDSTHDVATMTTPKGETTTIKRETHGNPEVIERPAPESKTQTTK